MKKRIAGLLAALIALTCCAPALGETVKHERVYVVAGPGGEVRSLTVNVRLENRDGLEEIQDASLLADIENVSGGETFSRDGDALIWQAQGNDIVYQGTSDRAPAVLPRVSLTLDGEEIPVEALGEKTGEAVLTVAFPGEGSAPALAVSVLPLPASGMTEIRAENAAILSEAGQRVLVGWAAPGVDPELRLPDRFTVSFHADCPDLPWMMTLISTDPIRLACGEIDARLEADPRGILALASSVLTALKDGEDLPMQPGLQNLKTNLALGGVNDFFHSLDQLDLDAQALSGSAAGVAEGARALGDGVSAARDGAGTLRSDLEELRAGGDDLSARAVALLARELASAQAELAALGLKVPELTAENYAAALEAAARGQEGEIPERIAALSARLDQAAALADDLKAHFDGVARAAGEAEALSSAAEGAAEAASALQEDAEALRGEAEKLQADGSAKVKSTVSSWTKKLAGLALPYVQGDLTKALDLYEQTRDQAQNSGYDLRPEGAQAVTVYVIRTDLK